MKYLTRFAFVSMLLMVFALAACGGQAQQAVEDAAGAVQEAQATAETAETAAMPSDLPDLGGREITVALENAYLPFNYVDPSTGEPAGWDYDAIRAMCVKLNCTPKFVEAAWEGMIQAVADGQYDMAADGITINDERAQLVDFSDGYINIDQRLLVRADESRFSSVDEFVNSDLVVGTQTGTTNFETMSALVPAERIQAFEAFPFAVQALIAGDVDAVIIDETAGLGYVGANADQLKLVGDSMSSDSLGFIFPKGSDLVPAFNAALKVLAADGTMQQLAQKYFTDQFTITYDDLGG